MIMKTSPLNEALANLEKKIQSHRASPAKPFEPIEEVKRSASKPNNSIRSPFPSERVTPEIIITDHSDVRSESRSSNQDRESKQSFRPESTRFEMPQITETEQEQCTEETERQHRLRTTPESEFQDKSFRTGSPIMEVSSERRTLGYSTASKQYTEQDDHSEYSYQRPHPRNHTFKSYLDRPEYELHHKIANVMDSIHHNPRPEVNVNEDSTFTENDERDLWTMFRKSESPTKFSGTGTNYLRPSPTRKRLYQPKEKIDRKIVHHALSTKLSEGKTRQYYHNIVDNLQSLSIKVTEDKPSKPILKDNHLERRDLETLLHTEFTGPQRTYLISEITRLDFVDKQLKKVSRTLQDSYLNKY